MKIDTSGNYTLRYTAEDECGNSAIADRVLIVEAPPRTVLYTDGTFIINERSRDKAANEALHGAATHEYTPFDPNGSTNEEKYIFSSVTDQPWRAERSQILSTEIGQQITPTSTAYWFESFSNCTNFSLGNLNTSNVVNITRMFASCSSVETLNLGNFVTGKVQTFGGMFSNCASLNSLDVSMFNTSVATNFAGMFSSCESLQTLDLSNFDMGSATDLTHMFESCKALVDLNVSNWDVRNVTNMNEMFRLCSVLPSLDISGWNTVSLQITTNMFAYCRALAKIYASNAFVTDNVTSGSGMFSNMSNNLVGGAGTVWSASNTYATYARIDNPPSAKGYFTLKTE